MLPHAIPAILEEEALQPEVDLIFAIRRDFAVIKEPFPADMLIPAASKSYKGGADRQSLESGWSWPGWVRGGLHEACSCLGRPS